MQEDMTIDSSLKEKAFQLVTNNYTNKNVAKYFEKTYFTILN